MNVGRVLDAGATDPVPSFVTITTKLQRNTRLLFFPWHVCFSVFGCGWRWQGRASATLSPLPINHSYWGALSFLYLFRLNISDLKEELATTSEADAHIFFWPYIPSPIQNTHSHNRKETDRGCAFCIWEGIGPVKMCQLLSPASFTRSSKNELYFLCLCHFLMKCDNGCGDGAGSACKKAYEKQ